jgi:hypothetical protein
MIVVGANLVFALFPEQRRANTRFAPTKENHIRMGRPCEEGERGAIMGRPRKKFDRATYVASAMQRCTNWRSLHDWVQLHTGLRVPHKPVCPNHDAPFEYLKAAYFEPAEDLVVWAPRGGGKTQLGAVATLLDLLHKPGVAVRIIGGSLAQSLRMWEQLEPELMDCAKEHLVQHRPGKHAVRLTSGSNGAVLTQSERAVRGLRVQKLRCDEVELFDRDVWEAAQLVTRSIQDKDGKPVRATVEAMSTFHKEVRPDGRRRGQGPQGRHARVALVSARRAREMPAGARVRVMRPERRLQGHCQDRLRRILLDRRRDQHQAAIERGGVGIGDAVSSPESARVRVSDVRRGGACGGA